MIIFVNFAPLKFGGGAERWMLDVASTVSTAEETALVDVHASVSNTYGKFVLKRSYDSRIDLNLNLKRQEHISLTFKSFIPFTQQWKKVRKMFISARTIYMRYELLETLLIFYFGGGSAIKKSTAGIHSPFLYAITLSPLGYLHNLLYGSFLSRWVLSKMHKVHVLNPIDYELFTKKYGLQNIVLIPNFISIPDASSLKKKETDKEKLVIAFVGELSMRKGVDLLIKVVRKSPENFIFHIVGDGPLRDDVEKLLAFPNVTYHGYVDKDKVQEIFAESDVLFVPSRAESFSLACLEAMLYGLPIISSTDTRIGLPSFVQKISKSGRSREYVEMLQDMGEEKRTGKLHEHQEKIQAYTKDNFSRKKIMQRLLHEVYAVN